MKDSEWIWTRWPVLKTFELRCDQKNKIMPEMVEEQSNLGPFNSQNIAKHSLEIVDHEDCPNLEKIVHSSYCDLPMIFPQFRGLFDETNSLGGIEELTFWQKNGSK